MSKPTIVVALLSAVLLASIARGDVTKATYTPVSTIVGVDVDPTGNTATSLDNIDRCVSVPVNPNATFNIDLFVMDVTDLNEWTGVFTYDGTRLQVTSINVNFFLKENPGDPVMTPPFDCAVDQQTGQGSCTFGGVDPEYAPDSGSGVLGRLAVKAIAAGTSRVYLGQLKPLSFVTLADQDGAPIGDLNSDGYFDGLAFNAMVAVGVPCPADADTDGFTNVEESIDGSDLLAAGSTPEICDGVDNDLDGLTDEGYDRNPENGTADCVDGASNTDGDGQANPTDPDDDNDGYADAQETYWATDSLADCAVNEYHSAWPLDLNNDKVISVLGDVLQFRGATGTMYGDGNFRKRLDLNRDGEVTVLGDVLVFRGHIGDTCS